MYKLIYFTLIVALFSCNKQNIEFKKVENLSKLTREVLSMKTITEMRNAQILLSGEERQQMWETKYNIILNNDINRLSNKQKSIIENFANILKENSIEWLIRHPEVGDNYIKNNIALLENYFSKEQLFMLVECPYVTNDFTIFDSDKIITTLSVNDVNSLTDNPCTCRYSISCVGTDNKCQDGGCTEVQKCGLFGTSSCTGKCTGINPE